MESKAVHGRVLGDYVAVVRRRWLVVLVALLVCFAAGLAFLQVAPKTYVSSAKVLVLPTSTVSVAEGSRTTDSINLDTEAQLVKSEPVAELAQRTLVNADPPVVERDIEPLALARRVTVTVPPNTTILQIEYAGSTPEKAQAGAQAFADAYLTNRRDFADQNIAVEITRTSDQIDSVTEELDKVNEELATATGTDRDALLSSRSALNARLDSLNLKLSDLRDTVASPGTVTTPAQLPNKPRDPNPMLVLPSALFLGLLLGLALALWRENVDQRIHASADIERVYGLTPLADLKVVLGTGAGRDSRHYDVRALYHSLRANGPEAAEVVLVVAPNSSSIAGGISRALGVVAARSGAVTSYISNDKNLRGVGPQASGGVLRTLNYRDAELVYDGEINAERLQAQINALRADNDFVVLGLPSDDPTVDLPMLCRHVDVVLVLVHLGQATRSSVGETLRSLKTARARTVFAVSVDMRRQHLLERSTPLPEDGFTEQVDPKSAERPLSKALQNFGKTSGDTEPPPKAARSTDAPARSK
jgi:capsular polysaccharide biosynthesis protein